MKRALLLIALAAVILPSCEDSDVAPSYPELPKQAGTPAYVPPPIVPVPVTAPTAPRGNQPPELVIRYKPSVLQGPAPFEVKADMCGSSDPDGDTLHFWYKFGNGLVWESFQCWDVAKYTVPGKYRGIFCVNDGWPDHEVCTNHLVTVE